MSNDKPTENKIADFPIEIDSGIKIPLSIDIPNLSKSDIDRKSIQMSQRTNHEVLLRIICKMLIESCINSSRFVVVDLGAWIGDNSIIWASMTGTIGGQIIAIDPAIENIRWMDLLSSLNNINNHHALHALCSRQEDRYAANSCTNPDQHMFSYKKIHHEKEKDYILSSSLDSIVNNQRKSLSEILLLHIDVEGMELDVLRGSENLILESQPFIIFENHILKESIILQKNRLLLANYGYKTYMINEILPGNNLDCRNFLALPKASHNIIKVLLSESFYRYCLRTPRVFIPAVPGGIIIPLENSENI